MCEMSGPGSCFICDIIAPKCPSCELVTACQDHIAVHRSGEKCSPFTIKHSPAVGHYMVAVRDIKQMEVILSESPTIVGPYTKSEQLHCVACFKNIEGNGGESCAKCSYPLCAQDCPQLSLHRVECEVFVNADWKFQDLSSLAPITAIRILNLKKTNPDVYRRFMKLEDHNDKREREEPELWDYHEEKIVRVLSQRLGGHDEAEVRAVLGKMFTNCGDLEVGPHQSRGCGYYPTYANMNHHCRSKWYFECRCSRCEDPRESGSLLSALLCSQPAPSANKTCGGLVLSSEPTSGDSDWQCESCDAKYDSQQVLDIITEISEEVKSAREEDQDCVHHYERVLHQFASRLHPHHYLIMEIKEKLAQILGNFPPYSLLSLPRHLKERKIQLCQDMLDVISRVDPGFTKTRGIMLSEMNKAKLLLAKERQSLKRTDTLEQISNLGTLWGFGP